jgi:hypothetical protein
MDRIPAVPTVDKNNKLLTFALWRSGPLTSSVFTNARSSTGIFICSKGENQ